jgi:hypothetical protein
MNLLLTLLCTAKYIVYNKEKVEHNAASVKAGNDLQLSS